MRQSVIDFGLQRRVHGADLEVFGGLRQAQRVEPTVTRHSAIQPRWSVSTRDPKTLACECRANIGGTFACESVLQQCAQSRQGRNGNKT